MRCKGKTISGKKCQRQCDDGYCWQHNHVNIQSGGAYRSVKKPLKFALPKKGNWTIYGRISCPYTSGAFEYLMTRLPSNQTLIFYDITKLQPNLTTQDLQSKLKKYIRNQRTIPMIFDDKNKFVGGFSDLQKKL